ncbi:MAG: hypothetical protein IKB01_14170 [Lachnospiraceae bacterium]|nr:hypothetical protein [Lachnospiraceae bacterium]
MSNYLSNLKTHFSITNIFKNFFIIYLPIFSFGIFGPTEIFFANHVAFGVIFSEFGWLFLGYGTLLAIILTIFTLFLPNLIQKIFLSAIWIFSLCGYVQTMFLNKNLDQIGATLDGYVPTTEIIIKNCLIWLAIIVVCVVIIIKTKNNWKTPVFLTSLILLATQGVAYGTLFISAPAESMEYIAADYYLSGEEQYVVSSQENVIVFILDTLSNTHFSVAEAKYPELTANLKDFTYYNNTDCNYVGTFPSVPHILTGYDMDSSIKVNDWISSMWESQETTRYYDSMHAAGYKINAFLTEPTLLSGSGSLSLATGKIDNLTNATQNIDINHELLYITLLEMSCYRFMPDYFKPEFDVPNAQYASIVSYPENVINYANSDFYHDLLAKGLSVNNTDKYVIFHHLNGIHELINDENCTRVESSTLEDTIKGILVMLEEYFLQLQELDVYDNSTIIITADHGTHAYPQSVFFIKHANEHHDQMQITNAPISLDELAPTIAHITTGESEYLGNTIYDFSENEQRERTLYIGTFDTNFPSVKRYDGTAIDGHNVYRLYTYTGDINDYFHLYEYNIYDLVPTMDSYY